MSGPNAFISSAAAQGTFPNARPVEVAYASSTLIRPDYLHDVRLP